MARPVITEWIGRDVSASRTAEKVAAKYTVAGKEFERAGGRMKGLTDVSNKLGFSMLDASVAAGAAGAAAVAFYKDTVRAASDLNETTSKTKAVFGAASDEVFAFGKTAATSVGQSQQQAEEAVATFGNLFTALGLGQKPAADMSIKLDQLAGDLASFNNVDPAQVLQDLRSGLVGEVEPLRKYGVALNAASVEQEAMRETGKRSAKQLTEAEKVTARYNLILQATKTAQGDFARTSDGLANSQRILAAEIENVKASIGTALLPVMTSGVHGATLLAEAFTKVDQASDGAATKLALLGPALGPLTLAWQGGADILHAFGIAQDKAASSTADQALQTAYQKKTTEDLRLEMARTVPGVDQQADATNRSADASKALTDKLATLKQGLADTRKEFDQQVTSVRQQIESYDGLISKSHLTATAVIGDLRQQTANYVTFAADVKYLIHKGIGQDALGWLEQKGPEYVHGLATGTDTQLAVFQHNWKVRGNAIKGPFADAMNAQYKKLKKTIEDMQDKINELSGKTIYLTAKASVEINKSVRLYLQSIPDLKAFHAEGTRIPGYGGGDIYPAMLEPGETVVSKEASKLPWMRAAFLAAGVPGYQLGGLATRYYNPVKAGTWKVGRQMDQIAAAAIGMLAQQAGYGTGFPGGAASGNVIRLALSQAKRMNASFKVALALMEAGIVESGLRNLPYGDRDSLGFLQQRPSQGWAHPMNISYAAWDFLRRAIPIQGRYGTAGALAQAVQRSAFPGRYDQQQARALGILNAYGYDQGGLLPQGVSVAVNRTGRPEPVGIDYRRLAKALGDELRANPIIVHTTMDGRRVDQGLGSARILNARRR
jgi:hypothetical protein